jgi:hypothetical protein
MLNRHIGENTAGCGAPKLKLACGYVDQFRAVEHAPVVVAAWEKDPNTKIATET